MTEQEFYKWFQALDLGALESVRDQVLDYALDNAGNTDLDELCPDVWTAARNTVLYYVDDPDTHGIFVVRQIIKDPKSPFFGIVATGD